ncbi:MAG: signal peptidase I [Gammaproteobacteria bacterium]
MNFNFEMILFYLTAVSGVIALLGILFWKHKRDEEPRLTKLQLVIDITVEYARAFFPVFFLVFVFRSFAYEPFRIPSGSLKPTLDIGDFILVNKFDYGIRLPVVHTKIYARGTPKRGDIIVFRWPPNPSVDFIKRVIGIPGDRISYVDKVLYVNGQKVSQTSLKDAIDGDDSGNTWTVNQKQEDFFGIKHDIYQNPQAANDDFNDLIVPKDMYFVMGDNRDNSADSRFWGFVPEENIVGKANLIWLSLDTTNRSVRFNRIGRAIH